MNYSVGLFNGIPDTLTSSGNSDFDNEKDVDGRLFLKPFVNDKDSALQGLGLGVAGGLGREKTHSAVTSGYKTDGQQTFFSYNAAVYADGDVWRLSPQAYYYVGSFGALAEYVVSTINLRPSAPTTTVFPPKVQLENKAWAVTVGYVITGEDATYDGVTPAAPFSWTEGTWGCMAGRSPATKILAIDPRRLCGHCRLPNSPARRPTPRRAQRGAARGVELVSDQGRGASARISSIHASLKAGAFTSATPRVWKTSRKGARRHRIQISF